LTPRNIYVHALNDILLDRLPGASRLFNSGNSVVTDTGDVFARDVSPETLENINDISGLPLANLRLKIGAPVMILRNLDPANGLCNGTRCTVSRFFKRALEIKLSDPNLAMPYRTIFPIALSTSAGELPFILTRKQFPLRLAFAMTVNKAQGQSLTHVGIDLRQQVFTHGQLYVAFSRSTTAANVNVLLAKENTDRKVENVVYSEVLHAFPLQAPVGLATTAGATTTSADASSDAGADPDVSVTPMPSACS
jgi:hypothetical protein